MQAVLVLDASNKQQLVRSLERHPRSNGCVDFWHGFFCKSGWIVAHCDVEDTGDAGRSRHTEEATSTTTLTTVTTTTTTTTTYDDDYYLDYYDPMPPWKWRVCHYPNDSLVDETEILDAVETDNVDDTLLVV